jgi:hypothetical protein
MMQDPYLVANKEFAMLLMNMTGTIIKRDAKPSEVGTTDPNEVSKRFEYVPPWFLTDGGFIDCIASEMEKALVKLKTSKHYVSLWFMAS